MPQHLAVPPSHQGNADNQHAQYGADVAVHHLDPGLREAYRAMRHGFKGLANMVCRPDGAQLPITPWPVWTAQTGVRQPHERTEHDEIQRQEPGQEDQPPVTILDFWEGHDSASPNPRTLQEFDDVITHLDGICV